MSEFSIDISKFVNKTEGRLDIFVRKAGLEIHSGVVHMTPVDTARAKSNWQTGINNMPVGTVDSTAWQSMYEKARQVLRRAVAGDVLYIINNVDYIIELERGSSKQAPSGMVAVTLRRLPYIVEKGVREAKQELP